MNGNSFFPSDGAESFVGSSFNADRRWIELQGISQVLLHLLEMGFEFRTLGNNDAIEITNGPAFFVDEAVHLFEEGEAVGAAPLLICGGEVMADIAEAERAEHGIHDGMSEDIGITVAVEAAIARQDNPT